MVFNDTFNNFGVIIFIVGGNRSTKKETTDMTQVTDTLSHKVVSSTPFHEWDSNLPDIFN